MAIANVVDEISSSIDKKYTSIGVFIDLSKAFDTVDHKILLGKLELFGIRGVPLCLLGSYLKNRSQFVTLNGARSSTLSVTCGVPQGSILAPLLFLIYVDDMQFSSKLLKFVLFADDGNIFASAHNISTICCTLNTELSKLSD